MAGLPKGLIANTLNTKSRRIERSHSEDSVTIPRLHVSSLIKSGTQDAFCAREVVLRTIEKTDRAGAGISPKFELLFAVGHFYGNHIVQRFLEKNPEWAKYAWGDWTCVCGHTKLERECMPKNRVCRRCRKPVNLYGEVDLVNPRKTVCGHADLIFNVKGYFYIYEFKSIDRADIVFEDIKEPLGDHLLQASNYYYMLKAEGKKVSKVIRFVYVDRAMDGLYKKLPYREVEGAAVNMRRLHSIYSRADACHVAMEKGELPNRICESITCSRAKQCSKAISCFERRKTTFKKTATSSG